MFSSFTALQNLAVKFRKLFSQQGMQFCTVFGKTLTPVEHEIYF